MKKSQKMNNESPQSLEKLIEFLNKLSKAIEITLHDIKINPSDQGLNGITIAQISDLHINEKNIELVEQAIGILNGLNPDIVVMTGDVICNGKKFLPDLIRLLGSIEAKIGKFACIGNHDHSDGDDSLRVQNMYKKSDFQVLLNQSAKVNVNGDSLHIAGTDDIELGEQNIIKMVKNIPEAAAKIFLTHNPFNFKDFSAFNPELVLAGHTHGCQLNFIISRIIYKLKLKSAYISGLYNIDECNMYVNRGIGTALIAPKIFGQEVIMNTPRINSKPEISVFRLVAE